MQARRNRRVRVAVVPCDHYSGQFTGTVSVPHVPGTFVHHVGTRRKCDHPVPGRSEGRRRPDQPSVAGTGGTSGAGAASVPRNVNTAFVPSPSASTSTI